MLTAQTSSQYWLIIGLILVVTTLMLISARRRLRQREPGLRDYARQQRWRLRDEQALKGDMEQLLVQLQELARQINSQIDTKFAKLEACISDADARIASLERLLKQAAGLPGLDVTVGDESAEASSASQPTDRPIRIDPVHQQIYQLADAGKKPVQIAQILGRTTGEIELILNLRRTTRD